MHRALATGVSIVTIRRSLNSIASLWGGVATTSVMHFLPMRTHVSFQRHSTTLDGEPPFGRDIADALVASLQAQGVDTTQADSLDYAYFIYAPRETRRCYVMTGLVDDGVRQWLISVDAQPGFLSRLFSKLDNDTVRSVVQGVHKFLTADDTVSSIRWYTADDWNSRPEVAWEETPDA